MKKQLNLILLLVFASNQLFSQIYTPSKDKLYQSLIGKVHTLSIFIDTAEDSWEEEEVEFYLEELNKSEEWILDQSSYYDVDLEFENDHFFENGDVVYLDSFPYRYPSSYKIRVVMQALGFESFAKYLKYSKFDLHENKLKLLFFVKSQSRSHAYNQFSNKDIDIAVIYCRNTVGMITDNYVISHEILHQFGAWDLYYGKSQTAKTAEKAKELYPNSIMIVTAFNKDQLEVDDLTAYLVGWHYDYKEEYEQFDKFRRPKSMFDKKKTRGKAIQFDLKRKKRKLKKDEEN